MRLCSYRGVYGGSSLHDLWLRNLPRLFAVGSQRVRQVLGVDIPEAAIHVHLQDQGPKRDGLHALTTTSSSGPLIILRTQALATHQCRASQTITHELTHLAHRLQALPYASLPRWLREGLALYTAGQWRKRVGTLAAIHTWRPGAPLEKLLLSIQGRHSLKRYGSYGAALHLLAQRDPALPAALIRANRLTPSLLGSSIEDLDRDTHALLANELRRHRPAYVQWQKLRTAHDAGLWEEAVQLSQSMLHHPKWYTTPGVLALSAHAYVHLGRPQLAVNNCQTILRRYAHRTHRVPWAAGQLPRLFHSLGEHSKARNAAQLFARNHPDRPRAAAKLLSAFAPDSPAPQ